MKKISSILFFIVENFAEKGLIAFFPSQELMKTIYNLAIEELKKLVIREEDLLLKNDLNKIINEKVERYGKTIVYAVSGGRLAEGIDLYCLDGICLVGVPLPPPTIEQRLKTQLYEVELNIGRRKARLFSYVFPAINKSVHALGRLLRSPRRPIKLFLLDDRYLISPFFDLLPQWVKQNRLILDAKRFNYKVIFNAILIAE